MLLRRGGEASVAVMSGVLPRGALVPRCLVSRSGVPPQEAPAHHRRARKHLRRHALDEPRPVRVPALDDGRVRHDGRGDGRQAPSMVSMSRRVRSRSPDRSPSSSSRWACANVRAPVSSAGSFAREKNAARSDPRTRAPRSRSRGLRAGPHPAADRAAPGRGPRRPHPRGSVRRRSDRGTPPRCRRPASAVRPPALHQQATSQTVVCQCSGSSSPTREPGRAPRPSCSRFAVLATQLSNVATDSSTRSPVASS